MMSRKPIIGTLCLSISLVLLSEFSVAQIAISSPSYVNSISSFDKFIPRPESKTSLDYDIWDSLLEEMVLSTGASSRRRMSSPPKILGTRLAHGHTSAYRLEGNRIPFSIMKPEFKTWITEYRQDLERIGSEIDISKLSRNEQLAFWFNLHNVVIIEQLALEYPVRRPEDLKIGDPKEPLHDAKIINIKDTKLSLRDIREEIVYANWRNPKVIYGFFLGDIGSPSIQNSAFTGNNVSIILDRTAEEFVNSLRGFYVRNNKQYISRIYSDVAKYYFPNFDTDVAKHLRMFMRDDVSSQILQTASFQTDRYEPTIADLTAGRGNYISPSSIQSTEEFGITTEGPSSLSQYVRELVDKRERLRERGLLGIVTIEDIPTIDPDSPEGKDIDLEP
ncbi:DUF547 domain-containing protein [Hellea sp.]|nr:DUF547 domain-containing protein [Hellea sp.]